MTSHGPNHQELTRLKLIALRYERFFDLNIYLLLVKTNGVAFLEPRRRAKHCSLISTGASPPAPELLKGQTPLVLDPLPPIFIDNALL